MMLRYAVGGEHLKAIFAYFDHADDYDMPANTPR